MTHDEEIRVISEAARISNLPLHEFNHGPTPDAEIDRLAARIVRDLKRRYAAEIEREKKRSKKATTPKSLLTAEPG